MSNRPTITDDIILEAATKVAAELDGDAQTIADHYSYGMDGYALAKELDLLCGWDIDVQKVEGLDGMDSWVGRIHEKKCKEWVEAESISPLFPNGTVIAEGVIEGVCEYSAARYLVKEHGCEQKGRWLLINFEDAVAA